MGARNKTKPVLVLGIGNLLMRDEGVGVHVVNRIMEEGDIPSGVEVIDGGTAGFDLVPLMKDREKIIIVDALSMEDSPGSIYRFTPEDVDSGRRGYSLHGIGIMDVIGMLRMMGDDPEIEIVGIVAEDISTLDISLSDAVMDAVPKAVSAVKDAVAR